MAPGGPGGQDAGGASSLRGSEEPIPDLSHQTSLERPSLPATSARMLPCWHTEAGGDKLLRSHCGSLCPGGGQAGFLSLWLAEKSQMSCSELTSKKISYRSHHPAFPGGPPPLRADTCAGQHLRWVVQPPPAPSPGPAAATTLAAQRPKTAESFTLMRTDRWRTEVGGNRSQNL